jgi:hypothetical protein
MRRRKRRLEVSTFPFLAVLLSCMGSLILVLLVMDRKAKLAARYKAEQAYAHAAEDAAKLDADRQAAHAARAAQYAALTQKAQEEWQRKRDALHARLSTEEQELQGQLDQLRHQLSEATDKKEAEKVRLASLKHDAEGKTALLSADEQALAAGKGKVKTAAEQSEAAKAALAKMTADLAMLERTLKDIREAKKREQQTYSVVPYRGKHGDNRRPLYIECAANAAVFHPGHKEVSIEAAPDEARAEVQRRIDRQQETLARLKLPAQTPYLMLLVRPEGVNTYYRLQRTLDGLEVDFGYEFIDPDWVLDFPEEEAPAAQPWMATAPVAPLPPTTAAVPGAPALGQAPRPLPAPLPGSQPKTLVRGGPGSGSGPWASDASSAPGAPGAASGFASGNPGSSGTGSGPGTPGPVGGPPGTAPNGTGSGLASGNAAPGASGTGSGPGGNGASDGHPGASIAWSGDRSTAPGARGNGPPGPGGNGNGTGGNPSGNATRGGSGDGPGEGGPASPGSGTGGIGTGVRGSSSGGSGAGTGSPGSSPGNAENLFPGSTAHGGPSGAGIGLPESGTAGRSGTGAAQGQPGATASNSAGNAEGTSPGAAPGKPTIGPPRSILPPDGSGAAQAVGAPGTTPTAEGGHAAASAQAHGTTGARPENAGSGSPTPGVGREPAEGQSSPDPASRYVPNAPAPPVSMPKPLPRRSPAPLKPLNLSGDRDYVIYIECRADTLVLYPSRQSFALNGLRGDTASNPLLKAVQEMIQRRQSMLRPEDPPYRPQVRFLVRPENLKTFHLAYPTLEALSVPKTRQNLEPYEDAATVAAGR